MSGNDQTDNYYIRYLPNSIIVNGDQLIRQFDIWYSNGEAVYADGDI